MTLKEWLPVRDRNRVALAFAVFGLGIFGIWNCIPAPNNLATGNQIFAIEFWPNVLSFKNYAAFFKSPSVTGMMILGACLGTILASVVILLIVPFWKFFHASLMLKTLIAVVSLMGGIGFIALLVIIYPDNLSASEHLVFSLISLHMFSLSTALFIFENELGREPRRIDPRVPLAKK